MEESKDLRKREPKLRHFVAGAIISGICVLGLGIVLVLLWMIWSNSDPVESAGLGFTVGMASLPFTFGFGFSASVRWFTEIEFWRCLRASLIALGGYGVAFVVWAGFVDGVFRSVLGSTFGTVARYIGFGACGMLLVAVGSAVGFGLSRFGRCVLDRRNRLDPWAVF